MSRNVWHKRYHGDALNGYMGLTLEQRGAYTTLLDLMYDTDLEIGIPDRDRWIAGHLNISVRRWHIIRAELIDAGKIDVIGGMISNSRYRKERENSSEISRKRRESGSSGGYKSGEVRRKVNENNDGHEAIASDLPLYARATESETEKNKKEEREEGGSQRNGHHTHTRATRTRGTELPPSFTPDLTDHSKSIVAQWPPGMFDAELSKFRDRAASDAQISSNWQAAFRTWIDRAEKWRNDNDQRHSLRGSRPNPAVDLKRAAGRRLAEEAEREDGGPDRGSRLALPPGKSG